MNKRARLIELFSEIPSLNSERIANEPLSMPAIKLSPNRLNRPTRPLDVTAEASQVQVDGAKPIDRLFQAIRKSSGKLEFSRTSLDIWRSTLVFQGDRCVRNSKSRTYSRRRDQTKKWAEGTYINTSRDVANDWFANHLLPRLRVGGNLKHTSAIIGAPGCGKSTLTKYLISENADILRKSKVVLSRFEFLKFWKEWQPRASSIDIALANYLSFIHARDLILDHFFDFENGKEFTLKFQYKRDKDIEAHLATLQNELDSLASLLGHQTGPVTNALLTETFAAANSGNRRLMEWLRELPTALRILLIGVFWDGKTLVTIFDGLDTLRIEDAFQKSDQWEAVKHIIRHRNSLSAPSELDRIGRLEGSNSIVVMRNNTAALLEYEFTQDDELGGLNQYYELGNLDGLAAIHSVVERAANLIPDVRTLTDSQKRDFVFDFMRVIQRTMLAIWRGHGPYAQRNAIYDFFDGNLRELFHFTERAIVWTVRQMLSSGMLESREYFSSDTATFVSVLASERGTLFLKRKAYRIVELLLFEEGHHFENCASVVSFDSPLGPKRSEPGRIVGNFGYSGHIDNIFNYIDSDRKASVDGHALLEKLRVVQLCNSDAIDSSELSSRLEDVFGYKPTDIGFLIRFLLKTNFLEARIYRSEMTYSVYLRTTTRGCLCVTSLLKNLSYLEHVFHKTLFPRVLVETITDDPRDKNSLLWAAHSVRNSFVLLAYFKHIEENKAGNTEVPENFRIFNRILVSIVRSLERMTRPGAPPQGALETSNQSQLDATWICDTAVTEIEALLEHWAGKGLLKK